MTSTPNLRASCFNKYSRTVVLLQHIVFTASKSESISVVIRMSSKVPFSAIKFINSAVTLNTYRPFATFSNKATSTSRSGSLLLDVKAGEHSRQSCWVSWINAGKLSESLANWLIRESWDTIKIHFYNLECMRSYLTQLNCPSFSFNVCTSLTQNSKKKFNELWFPWVSLYPGVWMCLNTKGSTIAIAITGKLPRPKKRRRKKKNIEGDLQCLAYCFHCCVFGLSDTKDLFTAACRRLWIMFSFISLWFVPLWKHT